LRSVEDARSVKHNEAQHGRDLYESEYRTTIMAAVTGLASDFPYIFSVSLKS